MRSTRLISEEGAAQDFRQAKNGSIQRALPAKLNLLLQTETRATQAHLWTGLLWKATRIVFLRACSCVPMQ